MEIAAKQKNYRVKQRWRQAPMQVSNSSVARPWTLEQNTSGHASRASKLWKFDQNNTKKGPSFGQVSNSMTKKGPSQNVRKSRRAKMGLPSSSSRFQPQLLLVKPAST